MVIGESVVSQGRISHSEWLDICFSPNGHYIFATNSLMMLFVIGIADKTTFLNTPYEQYFLKDSAPIKQDLQGNVLDAETNLPPQCDADARTRCNYSLVIEDPQYTNETRTIPITWKPIPALQTQYQYYNIINQHDISMDSTITAYPHTNGTTHDTSMMKIEEIKDETHVLTNIDEHQKQVIALEARGRAEEIRNREYKTYLMAKMNAAQEDAALARRLYGLSLEKAAADAEKRQKDTSRATRLKNSQKRRQEVGKINDPPPSDSDSDDQTEQWKDTV